MKDTLRVPSAVDVSPLIVDGEDIIERESRQRKGNYKPSKAAVSNRFLFYD